MTADVLFPTTAAEAASFYGDGAEITVFAGGTILLPEIAAGRVKPERALMLHRSGLDTLRADDDRVTIGAMVSIAALADSAESVLADAVRHLADGEVRRNATVGGNIAAPAALDSQRGDLGAPLIALGANVRSTGAGGERTEPIEDFLTGDRSGRLVLEIAYDRFDRRTGGQVYDAATLIRMRSPESSPARVRTAATCASASAGRAVAVRCRDRRAEPRAGRRTEGSRPDRRRRRVRRVPAQRPAEARS